MAAKLAAVLPEGPDWLYEIKWDGYRVEAIKNGDQVRLVSRNAKDLYADFPGVVEAVRGIKAASAIVDGEVVAVDEQGRTSFQALQNRSTRNAPHIGSHSSGPASNTPRSSVWKALWRTMRFPAVSCALQEVAPVPISLHRRIW